MRVILPYHIELDHLQEEAKVIIRLVLQLKNWSAYMDKAARVVSVSQIFFG